MKPNHFVDAKAHGYRTFARCLPVFILFSLLWTSPATGEAELPLPEQIVGREFSYTVQRGDSLISIGARFGVGAGLLAANNKLLPSAFLKLGQQLRIDNRHIVPNISTDGIVINIPQRMLFYFKEGRLLRSFPVGLGRPDWPTPTGPFKIVAKEENPTWDVPKSIQEEMRREGKVVRTCVPPGPDNPLGKHWLGLSIGGYGIHGTNIPASIYQFQTHGCIRAHSDDIAALFNEVSPGTAGLLVYRRLMIANVDGKIYLEIHRDIYKKQPDVAVVFEDLLKELDLDFLIDRKLAQDIIGSQDGIAHEIGVKKIK